VETTTGDDLSELTSDSATDTATTTTMTAKTTFDELMQALSVLEADDTLPTSDRRGPSWRESLCRNYHYICGHRLWKVIVKGAAFLPTGVVPSPPTYSIGFIWSLK